MYITAYKILDVSESSGMNLYGSAFHIYLIKVKGGVIKYSSKMDSCNEKGDVIYVIHKNKKLDLINNTDLIKVINKKNIRRHYFINRVVIYFLIALSVLILFMSFVLIVKGSYSGYILFLSIPFLLLLLRLNRGYVKLIKSTMDN